MFKKYVPILTTLICLAICACSSNQSRQTPKSKNIVKAEIKLTPSFAEKAEIFLEKTDSLKDIQILIRNNLRVDKNEDTFWFKKVHLTDLQYVFLDSSLVEVCKIKPEPNQDGIADGIELFFSVIRNSDTNTIYLHSPDKHTHKQGFEFSKALFQILKIVFKESLVQSYLSEAEAYIDDTNVHNIDYEDSLYRLRKSKYNWKYLKQ